MAKFSYETRTKTPDGEGGYTTVNTVLATGYGIQHVLTVKEQLDVYGRRLNHPIVFQVKDFVLPVDDDIQEKYFVIESNKYKIVEKVHTNRKTIFMLELVLID